MNAEIIAVGTELLLGQICNTNAQYLSTKLATLGINVFYHSCVGDNEKRILESIKLASDRSDLIIITGGLGPTTDDITKETLAKYLDLPLVRDEKSLNKMRDFFRASNSAMPDNNYKQIYIIENSIPLDNNFGTAPGIYIKCANKKIYILLPGPPKELIPMFENEALPHIKHDIPPTNNLIITSEILRFFGIGESLLEDKIKDIINKQSNPTIAPLCSNNEVTIRITAKSKSEEEAKNLIKPIKEQILEVCGENYYGSNDDSLTKVLYDLLIKHKLTISVAESCTGGLLSAELTKLSGSSSFFLEGLVCYSNEAKIRLGVNKRTIESYGAVSKETAIEMAKAIKNKCNSDISISITGIAGPSGGNQDKPVGLVYISFNYKNDVKVTKLNLFGSRNDITNKTVKHALFMLIQELKKKGEKSDY